MAQESPREALERPFVPDDPPLLEQMASTFRGSQRWLTTLVFVEGIVVFVLAVVTALRFFEVETARLQIGYVGSFLFLILVLMMIKVWYWMMLNRNVLMRRIVRLEKKLDRIARRPD
jgi:hypothetical protein